MSKGSGRRPQQVDDALMADNWSRAFGKTASYEEAPTLSDEMQQHMDKMEVPSDKESSI